MKMFAQFRKLLQLLYPGQVPQGLLLQQVGGPVQKHSTRLMV
jgi:hypothetical protein